MNVTQDPFTDRNVRLALKYAVNREEMVEKILGGYGSVGNDHPIPSSSPYFNVDLEQHSYDPDRARFHMKEAGLDSISTELHAADAAFTGAVDAATLYSESARAAGIDIKVAREPNDGYWKNIWRNKPWAASFWSGRSTADAMFSLTYASGAPWNETAWNNERFDKILIAARGELDEGKRREMYHEMQKLVHDEGGAVVPMFADYIVGLRDTVATPEVTGNNLDLDGLRFLERWWMA
jgi:peptide/nickel transport system substrate-binding protein